MEPGLGWKVLLWILFYCGVTKAEVHLRGVWKENYGLEVTCSWHLWQNDSLHSVRMLRNDRQYLVFRPKPASFQPNQYQDHISQAIPAPDFFMQVDCNMISGRVGQCDSKIEIYQNATEDTYTCDVSGERPHFRQFFGKYDVFVPPSDAVINVIKREDTESRKILNCSSTGLPAPKLTWSIDGRRIPSDFTNTTWNATTKLWHSWSSLNPQAMDKLYTCIPVTTTKSGQMERGRPLELVVTDGGSVTGVTTLLSAVSLILTLYNCS